MRQYELDKAAVIGAGLTGGQITLVLALGSKEVVLMSRRQETLNRALRDLRRYASELHGKSLLRGMDSEDVLARIRTTTSTEEAAINAEFVVEAVTEDLNNKREVFAKLDRIAPLDAILASNTSSLPITKIAEATQRPERVVGSHFVQPAHIVPIVEVVRGSKTSDRAVERSCEVWKSLDKIPIVVNVDLPGFLLNRLQHALVREATALLARGVASAEDIDTAVTLGLAPRFTVSGPLEQRDINGLAMHVRVASYLWNELDGWEVPLAYLQAKVGLGELGLDAGRGYYDWTGLDPGRVRGERDEALIERTRQTLETLRDRATRPRSLRSQQVLK